MSTEETVNKKPTNIGSVFYINYHSYKLGYYNWVVASSIPEAFSKLEAKWPGSSKDVYLIEYRGSQVLG